MVMSVVMKWDGKIMPEELRAPPAGRYVLVAVDSTHTLTDEENAGLESALASLGRGEGVEAAQAREHVESALRR